MKKTQKKRNDKTIFIIAVILFALAVGLFVGAYARFQSQVTGTATLTTANWHFDAHSPGTSTLAIDLLDTTVTGTSVHNLVDLGTAQVAQPGSYGQFNVVFDTTGSDVGAQYYVEVGSVQGQKSQNFAFYNDSAMTQELTSFSDSIAANTTDTKTIYWRWLYDASGVTNNDPYSAHYDDSPYAGQTLILPLTITGYQVEPGTTATP